MKPQLIVTGAAGRMGRRILALAVESGDFTIAGAIDRRDHPDIGKDAGTLAGGEPLNVPLAGEFAGDADVMIDFSSTQAAEAALAYCTENQVALVVGTTGLSPAQNEAIRTAGKTIPIVLASNMSVGMNMLFSMIGKIAAALGDEYDIEIVEHHHRFKKDAPSGSALSLAEHVAKETGREMPGCIVNGRSGKEALRQKGEIGMHAVRAGDIVGYHEVLFSTLGETVKISHNAHSRDVFVRGSMRAARWISGKPPGVYTMLDVLGLGGRNA